MITWMRAGVITAILSGPAAVLWVNHYVTPIWMVIWFFGSLFALLRITQP